MYDVKSLFLSFFFKIKFFLIQVTYVQVCRKLAIFHQLYYKSTFAFWLVLYLHCVILHSKPNERSDMGLPNFVVQFFSKKKPKKSLMEMVVLKSKKNITFSTTSFLLRMPIIWILNIWYSIYKIFKLFLRLFLMKPLY